MSLPQGVHVALILTRELAPMILLLVEVMTRLMKLMEMMKMSLPEGDIAPEMRAILAELQNDVAASMERVKNFQLDYAPAAPEHTTND